MRSLRWACLAGALLAAIALAWRAAAQEKGLVALVPKGHRAACDRDMIDTYGSREGAGLSNDFRVFGGEILCQANLALPRFDLFESEFLERTLFEVLTQHGLRLADMRFESGTNFGEEHLLCTVTNLATLVRAFFERVDIHCFDVLKPTSDSLKALTAETLGSLQTNGDLRFRTHALTIALHGHVDGVSAREFLLRHIPYGPSKLGPPIASGGVFYFGAEEDRIMSAITLDLSGAVQDGIFLRIHSVLDGDKLSPRAVPESGQKYLLTALNQLDLRIPTLG
jgi:hypothetical protein